MADNKYTGDTPITLGGKQYALLYDWNAHGAIKTAFQNRDIHALLNGGDPADRAKLLEIGLRRHHLEMTAEKIMDLSPPLIPTLGGYRHGDQPFLIRGRYAA